MIVVTGLSAPANEDARGGREQPRAAEPRARHARRQQRESRRDDQADQPGRVAGDEGRCQEGHACRHRTCDHQTGRCACISKRGSHPRARLAPFTAGASLLQDLLVNETLLLEIGAERPASRWAKVANADEWLERDSGSTCTGLG